MLFHASAVLMNRQGDAFREPKVGERPKTDPRTGTNLGFEEIQKRDVRHGDVAVAALDSTLEGDEKHMREAPDKWVRSVMRRETIARTIAEAMSGDGWATLSDEQRDLLQDRLAIYAVRMSVAMVGPVMSALDRPPAAKALANGRDRDHADAVLAN